MPPPAKRLALVRPVGKPRTSLKLNKEGLPASSNAHSRIDPKPKSLRTQLAQAERAAAVRAEAISKVLQAEDSDNARVSRLLHDNIGQYFVALQLGLRGLERELAPGAAGKLALRSLQALSESAAEDLHRVALELRPTALADYGLARALQSVLEEWSLATRIVVDFDHAALGDERLPRHLESTLFRVIREILGVAKKAAVAKVHISLQRKAGSVVAVVESDGTREVSFSETCFADAAARISLLDGSLELDEGRSVIIRLPIRCQS